MKWNDQMLKHIYRVENNYHVTDMVQAFLYIENGGLNMVLQLAKTLICLTLA